MESRTAAIALPRSRGDRSVRWSLVAPIMIALVALVALQAPAPFSHTDAVPSKSDPALYGQAAAHPHATYSVIVREADPSSSGAEELVRSLGGHPGRQLSILGGFAATVPGSAVASLTASPDVLRVWGDGHIRMTGVDMARYDYVAADTVWQQIINLPNAWKYSRGAGVGVALIDTGVVPVPDLANRITHVVDFTPEHDGMDRFGHGTHMAGLIVGDGTSSGGANKGVAPQANLISLKVAGYNGATDVSVVIAALQWIVSHRADYNIRVANLSFGTDSTQPYSIDPLDYAVEQVWNSGVFVSVAAGNRGPDAGTVNKPADDPYIVAVGGANLHNTFTRKDDEIADFSSRGPTQGYPYKPDLVAPAVTLVSARDKGSTIDTLHPAAAINDSYFKGTGTSQAAAIISGVAALMFGAKPSLTNDYAKTALLVSTKKYLSEKFMSGGGWGMVQADEAVAAAVTGVYQETPLWPYNATVNPYFNIQPSTGTGSLEASRGSLHVYADLNNDGTVELVTGEVDVLANSWSANSWSANSWSANSWSANSWSGYTWEANSWSANSWSGNSWSANSWSGNSWSANSWSANSWSGNSWSANSWSANSWCGNSWSANTWS